MPKVNSTESERDESPCVLDPDDGPRDGEPLEETAPANMTPQSGIEDPCNVKIAAEGPYRQRIAALSNRIETAFVKVDGFATELVSASEEERPRVLSEYKDWRAEMELLPRVVAHLVVANTISRHLTLRDELAQIERDITSLRVRHASASKGLPRLSGIDRSVEEHRVALYEKMIETHKVRDKAIRKALSAAHITESTQPDDESTWSDSLIAEARRRAGILQNKLHRHLTNFSKMG